MNDSNVKKKLKEYDDVCIIFYNETGVNFNDLI